MIEELCEITKKILETEDNLHVLKHIRGENHPKKIPQACENWIQVEIAKKLAENYENVRMEIGEGGHDILFTKENNFEVAVEIKFKKKSDKDYKKIKGSLDKKTIAEGYVLIISAGKIQEKEGKSVQIMKGNIPITIYSEKYK